jgi:hypothetical protein
MVDNEQVVDDGEKVDGDEDKEGQSEVRMI